MPKATNSKKCPLGHPLCKPSEACVKCIADELALLSAHFSKLSKFLAHIVSVKERG